MVTPAGEQALDRVTPCLSGVSAPRDLFGQAGHHEWTAYCRTCRWSAGPSDYRAACAELVVHRRARRASRFSPPASTP